MPSPGQRPVNGKRRQIQSTHPRVQNPDHGDAGKSVGHNYRQPKAGKWKGLPDPKTYPYVQDPNYEDTRSSLNDEYERWWRSLLPHLKPFAIAELKKNIKDEIEKIPEIKLLRLWEPEKNGVRRPVDHLALLVRTLSGGVFPG